MDFIILDKIETKYGNKFLQTDIFSLMKDGSIGDIQILLFEHLLYEYTDLRREQQWTGRLFWRRQDRDRFLVQARIKLNFSECILTFDLVFGFYCSEQK